VPLVSVIVPAFDAEGTVAEAVTSALGQSHGELEVLVVDDGSRDRTADVVSSIGDSRVRLLRCANSGQATARNRGVERARGDFLSFLDADDLWTPDKLEAQLARLDERPEAGAAYSWTDCIDERGGGVRPGSHLSLEGEVLAALLQVNFVESGSNLLVRRGVADRVGPFAPELVPCEDWDWSLRLAAVTGFAVVPRAQVLYRLSRASQSADVDRLERAAVLTLQRALESHPRLAAVHSQAFANLYRYLLFKLLEHPPRGGRSPGAPGRALELLRELARHDPRTWRRATTRRALLRACAFACLPPARLERLQAAPRGLSAWLGRRLSVEGLRGQIRIRRTDIDPAPPAAPVSSHRPGQAVPRQ
jgi:glycosyltransferase involved in cell wall biosynthesis